MILRNQHHCLITFIQDALNGNANQTSKITRQCNKMFESRVSAGATGKLPRWDEPRAKTSAWSYDMEGHARKCMERYCELANKKTEQLHKVSSPCLDDHQSCFRPLHCLFFKQYVLFPKWTRNVCGKCILNFWISFDHHSRDAEQNLFFSQIQTSWIPPILFVSWIHVQSCLHRWSHKSRPYWNVHFSEFIDVSVMLSSRLTRFFHVLNDFLHVLSVSRGKHVWRSSRIFWIILSVSRGMLNRIPSRFWISFFPCPHLRVSRTPWVFEITRRKLVPSIRFHVKRGNIVFASVGDPGEELSWVLFDISDRFPADRKEWLLGKWLQENEVSFIMSKRCNKLYHSSCVKSTSQIAFLRTEKHDCWESCCKKMKCRSLCQKMQQVIPFIMCEIDISDRFLADRKAWQLGKWLQENEVSFIVSKDATSYTTHHVWNCLWSGCLGVGFWIRHTWFWTFGSRLILSNIQPRATRWVRDTCLIVGLLPLMNIFTSASLSSKMYNSDSFSERCAFDLRLIDPHSDPWVCFWIFASVSRMHAWVDSGDLGVVLSTSMTKSQKSSVSKPSIRKPASNDIISESVELWDTDVCFLHTQLIDTNVRLPKMHKRCWFRVFKISSKFWFLKQP